jgi:hypothetical protein
MSETTTLTTTVAKEKFFVIADIHGEFDKLIAVRDEVAKAHPEFTTPFGLGDGWELVQLGDKNDRGPKTYEVFQYFHELDLMFPGKVSLITGNHELMMLDAAKFGPDTEIFYKDCNGGKDTLKSYSSHTKFYGKKSLGNSLVHSGHHRLFQKHIYFLETEDYFFCHAPIPKAVYRRGDRDFRSDIDTLTWGYNGAIPEEQWVEPFLVAREDGPGYKTCVFGHLHGIKMYETTGPYGRKDIDYVVPGVRQYGESILLDTGAGCLNEAWLSCLELPARIIYDSRGKLFHLDDVVPVI